MVASILGFLRTCVACKESLIPFQKLKKKTKSIMVCLEKDDMNASFMNKWMNVGVNVGVMK
jgi:hypothetical protein